MHEDEETEPTEEQEQRVEDADASYLDLEGDREMQAYNHVKNCEFIHTPAYDPDLLDKIGMDTEFTTIWKVIGWERVAPVDEKGSRILTIQFLCSLKEVDNGINFCLFGNEYFLTWKNLAIHLSFNSKCSIDLNYSVKGFNCHAFWKLILNQDVVGKFQPHNMNINHPTLRFTHRWIAMTLFARDDIHYAHHVELQLLYAILKNTKVAPVKEIFNHWIDTIKASTPISCTSLVTRLAAGWTKCDIYHHSTHQS
jgi:hypothetical protein